MCLCALALLGRTQHFPLAPQLEGRAGYQSQLLAARGPTLSFRHLQQPTRDAVARIMEDSSAGSRTQGEASAAPNPASAASETPLAAAEAPAGSADASGPASGAGSGASGASVAGFGAAAASTGVGEAAEESSIIRATATFVAALAWFETEGGAHGSEEPVLYPLDPLLCVATVKCLEAKNGLVCTDTLGSLPGSAKPG